MAKVTATGNRIAVDEVVEVEQSYAPSAWGRVWEFLRGPYPTLVSRLALGVLFLLSGLSKLGTTAAFAANIRSYEMNLPAGLVSVMAVGLPPLEVGLGVWLLAGLFLRFSGAVSAVLMAVFTVAIAQAWLRGLDINCGCFAGSEGNPLGTALISALGPVGTYLANEKAGPDTVIRDAILVLMSVHLIFVPSIFALDNLRRRRAVSEEEEEYVEEEAAEA